MAARIIKVAAALEDYARAAIKLLNFEIASVVYLPEFAEIHFTVESDALNDGEAALLLIFQKEHADGRVALTISIQS